MCPIAICNCWDVSRMFFPIEPYGMFVWNWAIKAEPHILALGMYCNKHRYWFLYQFVIVGPFLECSCSFTQVYLACQYFIYAAVNHRYVRDCIPSTFCGYSGIRVSLMSNNIGFSVLLTLDMGLICIHDCLEVSRRFSSIWYYKTFILNQIIMVELCILALALYPIKWTLLVSYWSMMDGMFLLI